MSCLYIGSTATLNWSARMIAAWRQIDVPLPKVNGLVNLAP